MLLIKQISIACVNMLKIIAVVFKIFNICSFYIEVLILFTPIKYFGLQRSILLF
jgi:hypothetical protein